MTNLKYLKENNLFEAHMRFKQALGEGYGYAPLEEADDDDNKEQNNQDPMSGQNPMGGGQDPMGGMSGGDPMGGGQDPMGGAPGGDPMGGGQDPMGGMPGGDPMGGGQDPMGGAPDGNPMGGGQDPMGDMPGGDPMGGEDPMGDMSTEEEDDVLDVDDLTDAQEKVNKTVNNVGKDLGKVDTKLEKLMGAIDKLSALFDMNNKKIEDLKTEFEKRNPTQTEKLNIRSLDSFPFNVSPNDYWVEKAKNSNYSAYGDNSEPTTQEYVITNNDVDDMSERDVADSFFVADDFNQTLKKIFDIT